MDRMADVKRQWSPCAINSSPGNFAETNFLPSSNLAFILQVEASISESLHLKALFCKVFI